MKYLAALFLALILGAISAPAEAAARFAVCSTTCTWDNSSTAMWSLTTGGATGQTAPTSADDVTLDGATCVGGTTCTITVNANIAIKSLTMGACTGTTTGCILDLSVNNNSMTINSSSGTAFSGTGTGTRTLKMGNGAWTITSGSTIQDTWLMTTTTNLTFTPGASTLTIIFTRTAASQVFTGGGLTYGSVTLKVSGSTVFPPSIVSANTFGSLLFDTSTAPFSVTIPAGSTQTITGTLPAGTGSASRQAMLMSATAGTTATIAAAGATGCAWIGLRDITFTGAPTCNNSFDLGHNSGVTINPPVASGGGGGGGYVFGG